MLAPVPNANQRSTKAPLATSNSRYGLIAKAEHTHRINDNAMFIVTANLPTNCSYAGLAKFTIVVITMAVAIKIKIVVCMCISLRIKFT